MYFGNSPILQYTALRTLADEIVAQHPDAYPHTAADLVAEHTAEMPPWYDQYHHAILVCWVSDHLYERHADSDDPHIYVILNDVIDPESGEVIASAGDHLIHPAHQVRIRSFLTACERYHIARRSDTLSVIAHVDTILAGAITDHHITRRLARLRVEKSPALQEYADLFFYDWPDDHEHYRWLYTAPVEDLLDWAEHLRHVEKH